MFLWLAAFHRWVKKWIVVGEEILLVYWWSLQQIIFLENESNKELKSNKQQEPVFTSQDIYYNGELLFSTESYVNK